jgi:hypothetical protein
LRVSPTPPRIPSSQPPTEADRAQAVAIADVLAGLIGDCDAQLAALDADGAQAIHDGALRAARAIHTRSLQVRRDLEQLQAMEYPLIRRFFAARGSLRASPSA